MTGMRAKPLTTRWWRGRWFVTLVVLNVGVSIGWQSEGSYVEWRASPIRMFRFRGQHKAWDWVGRV